MKYLTIIILLAVAAMNTHGQDRQDMRDRLESQKVAFITTELDLTSEEAQRFWPIYNEYNTLQEAERKKHKMAENSSSMEPLSETEAAALVENMLAQQEAALKLKRDYAAKLRSAISSKKIAQLFMLEKQFKEKLMSKIRKKMRRRGIDNQD